MSEHHSDDAETPLAKLLITVTGAGGSEHENDPPGVQAINIKAGHEPDQFDVKPILYVPLLVVIVLVVAYVLTTGIFFNIKDPKPNPNADPEMVKQLQQPSNERFVRVSSTDPDAPVKQPRLEYFKKQQTRPYEEQHLRPRLPLPEGNTPEITPQDLRADRFVDPSTGKKMLAEYGWINKEKNIVRVPIDQAINEVITKMPLAKDAKSLEPTTAGKSKLSNAGRGGPSEPVAAHKNGHHDH
jgi:hypothetical protein